jgi:hypothetical protein
VTLKRDKNQEAGEVVSDDRLPDRYEGQTVAEVRHLTARQVLDLHADLHRSYARPEPMLRQVMDAYARKDLETNPEWAASHLHPAVRLSELDPWLNSFATDLFGATTYQVTAEMVELAEGLTQKTPNLSEMRQEDLPAPWGFAWLDKPIPRPSVDDGDLPPQLMHAFSWAVVPELPVRIGGSGGATVASTTPGIRLRKWGYSDDPSVYPRPLHMMGQSTIPVGHNIHTNLPDHHMIHMIWILMGMEIVSTDPEQVDRGTRRRAKDLKFQQVHVVQLRRTARRDTGPPRKVDWSCTWLVRGHPRKAPGGGKFADGRETTWVKPHVKGPDGQPFRASDLLYKLSR